MTDTNKDVDLYAELKATLESVDDSEEAETSVASDQKPKEEVIDTPKDEVIDENEEMSEEEISKLSPRAQKRIRELADKVKELAEKPAEKSPEDSPETKDEPSQDFKNVQEFLLAVEDEPSRKLLEKFYGVIKNETSNILAPIEQKNNEAKFETEFSKYEKIEGLADYKNDLKKTFLRNPSQSFEGLVGKVALDLQINKIKPIENKPSSPNRDGKIDTSNLTLEQLYELQETLKE